MIIIKRLTKKEYNKKYRAEHKEERKKYYAEHKEEIAARTKKYCERANNLKKIYEDEFKRKSPEEILLSIKFNDL